MSSDEENRFEYSEENGQEVANNDQSNEGEKCPQMDGLTLPYLCVNAEIKCDDDVDQKEQSQEQQETIIVDELPPSDNTHNFKKNLDSAPTFEERRAERRRERRLRRKLTEEEDGPTEGSAQSTLGKFEEGKIDDIRSQKTDTSQDSMATEGTVSLTTAKFKSGNVSVSSEDDDTNKVGKEDGDKHVVEIGTAATRRRALEEYAQEAQKEKSAGDSKNTLEDEGIVLSLGSAASTKAKLERFSSEEKVFEKQVDENAPKRGAASEKRAKFEGKARHSSEEKDESAKKLRASKWPEPKTNYKGRRGLRRSASTDEDAVASTAVDKENAKNIEKSKEAEQNGDVEPTGRTDERQRRTSRSTQRQSSADEEPSSPVRTSEIRNKLVRMLSQEERPPPVDRIGSARPLLGTARNLRARFEAGQVKTEDSHATAGKKASISSRSGYASKVRERFESGEVSRRRNSSTVDEEDLAEGDTVVIRRRRTSSARSSEGESVTMSRSAKELRNRFENPPQSTNQQVKKNFVLRSKTASTLSSKFNKSSPVRGPAINKCTTCAKTVYPMEMITADDKPFHRFCFKCTECKATLRLGNYAALQGKIYCKPHFKQLFKVKGNYDEGFGRQQHKKHWEEKGKTEESGENGNDENENDINSDLKSPTEFKHEITNGYEDEDTSVNSNVRLHDMQDALFEEVDA